MDKESLVKLTSNLYRLTLLFPKKEPLRYKMRELADEVLANCLVKNPQNKMGFEPPAVLKDLEVLDSFFEIAKAQNWINSDELFSIQQEYGKIRERLEELNIDEATASSIAQKPEEKQVSAEKKNDLNGRQEKILEILKEKEKAQVGEFKQIFPDVSKRTLRRDFRHLLKEGKIQRIGEKNDTHYLLISRT